MEVLLHSLQFISLRFVQKYHNVSVLICNLLHDVASNLQIHYIEPSLHNIQTTVANLQLVN